MPCYVRPSPRDAGRATKLCFGKEPDTNTANTPLDFHHFYKYFWVPVDQYKVTKGELREG